MVNRNLYHIQDSKKNYIDIRKRHGKKNLKNSYSSVVKLVIFYVLSKYQLYRIGEWIQIGGCPETATSDSSSNCGHRPTGSTRDLQERVPLLPPHCSSSNGSLATGSLKKFTTAGSSSKVDDNCSTCSEVPPLVPKAKKHSSGSLIDTDKLGTKETVVRIPNSHFGNEI